MSASAAVRRSQGAAISMKAGSREARLLFATVSALALVTASSQVFARSLGGGDAASSQASSAAMAAAQAGASQAAAMALRAQQSLSRSSEALSALRAAQAAARSAAQLGQGGIPNGLQPGGLQVAPGISTDPTLWQGAKLPTETSANGRSAVEVVQTQQKAILTWKTFNVGRETDLNFNQKAGGTDASQWIALNRVLDPNAAPSRVLGTIKADGQVYVINQNGIVFGGGSQVNVHTLVTSSLDLVGNTIAERNEAFKRGILFNSTDGNIPTGRQAQVKFGALFPDAQKSLNGEVYAAGDGVTVEAGALITTHARGAAMLFGHNVVNRGTITSPDGQVVIAAGGSVYLARNYDEGGSADPGLRGVLAGVDRGGQAINAGIITTERGNITITGKSVVQGGALLATTAARANGSMTLVAGDNIYTGSGPGNISPTRAYDATLLPSSLMAITPDTTGEKAIGFDQFRPSKIDVRGRFVTMGEDATIYAPGGRVGLVARLGDSEVDPNIVDDSRLYIDRGALIDVAGLTNVVLPMERNVLTIDLRLNELRDSPALRDSPLRGQKISLDIRKGTRIADLSGYYALVEREVGELMVAGGTVNLGGAGVITRAGSRIDLSGGYLQYLDGYIQSTTLLGVDGRRVDISKADPNQYYVGVYNGFVRDHQRWGVTEHFTTIFDRGVRWERGYTEGRNAGTLLIGGSNTAVPFVGNAGTRYVALDGDVTADIVAGEHQVDPSKTKTDSATYLQDVWHEVPRLASLTTGHFSQTTNFPRAGFGPDVTIGTAPALPDDFASMSPLDRRAGDPLVLPSRYFDGKTFGHLAIYSGGNAPYGDLVIPEGVTVDLGAGGSFTFEGSRARIDGAIVSPGGSVSISTVVANTLAVPGGSRDQAWNDIRPEDRPWLKLGAHAVIDVSGRWINQQIAPLTPGGFHIDGGSVSLVSSNDLILSRGSVIDVSGGGRLTRKELTAGDGGGILLQNDIQPYGATGVPTAPGGVFDIQAELRAYALGTGGSLTIGTSRSILIGHKSVQGVKATDTLVIAPEFFEHNGFASYSIASARNLLVDADVIVTPRTKSYIWDRSIETLQTGGDLSSVLDIAVLPDDLRGAMRLVLGNGARNANGVHLAGGYALNTRAMDTFYAGTVTLGRQSAILMDPGSSVLLRSLHDIYIDGTIVAPGGLIDAAVSSDFFTARPPSRTLRLGSEARLLAPGYQKAVYENGRLIRTVHAGGTVSLSVQKTERALASEQGPNRTFIDTDRHSVIDVSGIAGEIDLHRSSSGTREGNANLNVTLPKFASLIAGKDLNGNVNIQNNSALDQSYVGAGRDMLARINIIGPGALVVEAGRDVGGLGIESAGNYPGRLLGTRIESDQNLALRDIGADIAVIAGTASAPGWTAFAAAYLDPANAKQVIRTYLPELRSYMATLGYRDLDDASLVAAFHALPTRTQQPLLRGILFSELKETGIDATAANGPRRNDYARGYNAIALLFPEGKEGEGGNIDALRAIQTLAGGGIQLMAPHGRVTIGVDNPESNFDPNNVGVVTRRGGDIQIMSRDSIALGRSRVFTLQGGNIIMWTSEGDITAGTGSKTTAVFPPLSYTISNDAFVSLNAYGLQTGAGIGALDALRDGTRSRIDLLAPHGEVNAGDAGIRVTGDINIAALRVTGIDNIQVGGTSTGVPQVQSADVAGQLSASNSSAAAAKTADAPRGGDAQQQPSVIIVEVLGYGGGGERGPEKDEEKPREKNDTRQSYDPNSMFQVVGNGELNDEQKRKWIGALRGYDR